MQDIETKDKISLPRVKWMANYQDGKITYTPVSIDELYKNPMFYNILSLLDRLKRMFKRKAA